ncbi:CPXCG motif-containing cysteine-rich protein [Pseudomaricurvus alkylphenolicus]|uniref:CPXCG motif-containing cysteine-rich protein n=1 Tax=Pseudomaricurvus alkylphenolicus TaxID=1306991 RepID=UPI00141E8ADA|nr:CPXCG motif-containing cysteine-rich protein [Pseudomaricurvus alkylphenolicus]
MDAVQETQLQCPYCWQTFTTLVDTSEANQTYTEDCQICCRPMVFLVQAAADGQVTLQVFREDDATW